MLKKSLVLDVNKEYIILNWIKSNVWNGESFRKSLNKTLDHYSKDFCLINDMNQKQTKEFLLNYLEELKNNNNTLDKFLKRIYETYTERMNFKKFMLDNELPFKDKTEFKNYIAAIEL